MYFTTKTTELLFYDDQTAQPVSVIPHISGKMLAFSHPCHCIFFQQLTVPGVTTELANRAFHVAAPSIWNGLPVNVQSSQSVAVLKSGLKTFFF